MSFIPNSTVASNDFETLIGPRPRVRSGCLTCRKRKVKCDEQRPNCFNCTRLRRTCIFADTSIPSDSLSLEPRSKDTTSVTVACSAASTTLPDGSSTPSPSPLFPSELQGWTTPLNLLEFGTGIDQSLQEQSDTSRLLGSSTSPLLSWSQMALFGEASLCPGPSLLPVQNDATPFLYFIEQVDPPFIGNIDNMNWKSMKRYTVELGCHHPVVSQAISAVESLYKAKANCDRTTSSMALYYVAKTSYVGMLEQDDAEPEIVLTVTFLLCCFEIVAQHETVPITLKPEGALVAKLEAWEHNTAYAWSPVVHRLRAWFKIFHARSMHLGGPGLLSPKVDRLLTCHLRGQTPTLSHIGNQSPCLDQAILADLSSPLFEFYLEIQVTSTQIASLNRHHRSRGFQTDEREVQNVAEEIQEILHHIWQRRPALLRLDRRQLQEKLTPDLRSTIGRLADLCCAAYFTEIIYLGRAYGKTSTASAESLEAMKNIHHIIDSSCGERSTVDPGFIWPLFMYAVEHPDPEQSRWAVSVLHRVQNPLWHSDFVSSLAQGISEKQFSQAKRVDTRYFCFEHFSTPPPFI